MKKLLFTIGLCLTAMVCSVSGSFAKQQSWKIGHVRPVGSAIDNDIRQFTEAIATETGGAIDFTIYPANKLGDYSVVQDRVSFGEVEMYVGPFGTAVDKKLMLAFTTFMLIHGVAPRDCIQLRAPYSSICRVFSNRRTLSLLEDGPFTSAVLHSQNNLSSQAILIFPRI